MITDIKYFLYLEKESTVKGEFQLWQKKVCKVSTSYKGWQKKPSAIKALNICEAVMFPNLSKI